MKVRSLVAELEQLDQDAEVILSSDEEGNSFAGLHGLSDHDKKVVLYPGGNVSDNFEEDIPEQE